MPTHHDRRIFHTTIFITTIFAFVMSSVGAHAQRSNAPPLKRAETTELTDAPALPLVLYGAHGRITNRIGDAGVSELAAAHVARKAEDRSELSG